MLLQIFIERSLMNEQRRARTWGIYLQSSDTIYRGPCLASMVSQNLEQRSFIDWKNASERATEHENSNSQQALPL
jgi:hypothetical protein